MIQAHATARYVRTSAQKAGLVLALIRGKDVNRALATLQFTRKAIAEDISKVLRSAIANATNKEGFSGDNDPTWIGIGFAVAEPGLVLLLVALGFAFWWQRSGKAVAGRVVAGLSTLYALLLAVAWLAMSGKWG